MSQNRDLEENNHVTCQSILSCFRSNNTSEELLWSILHDTDHKKELFESFVIVDAYTTAKVLKICRTPSPTACFKKGVCMKGEKHPGPRQPAI